eukprot:2379753-Rhodomonas_salina.1
MSVWEGCVVESVGPRRVALSRVSGRLGWCRRLWVDSCGSRRSVIEKAVLGCAWRAAMCPHSTASHYILDGACCKDARTDASIGSSERWNGCRRHRLPNWLTG